MRIPIVNEQDEIIKIIDIDKRQHGDIKRVSSLWVANEKGEILLAQRAFTKLSNPGKWSTAVAGRNEEGETYESNIIKEAEEEIGLKNFILKTERKIRRSSNNDEYFSQWFSTVVDSNYPFVKQDLEVEKIQWFTKEEIIALHNTNPEIFVSSFGSTIEYFLNNENQN